MVTPTLNTSDLWQDKFPRKNKDQHKYDHGHALIYGAPEMTGATRLSASACAQIGTGLVSVLCTQETYDIYRQTLPAHVIVRNDLNFIDGKVTARAYGSGGLPCPIDFDKTIPTVLDADALKVLPMKLSTNYILTPHEGEFERAFPGIEGSREEKALKAAQEIQAIIVLKGAATLIAHPDGRLVKNTHATPWLATAGSGDVLAGMITGLLAQGMNSFEAACAAVWLHGEAGIKAGDYLTASDLLTAIKKMDKNGSPDRT